MSRVWGDKPQTWNKFCKHTFDEKLLSKIFKELLKLNSKITKNPIKKLVNDEETKH